MRDGDKLRYRGPAGAPFVVTVGPAFTVEYIEERLRTGEWQPLDAEKPRPAAPAAEPENAAGAGPDGDGTIGDEVAADKDPARPVQAAPKSEWIAYVVRRGLLSAEDAANYTKTDLIEIAS